jgi:hypothetical protein
MRTIAAIGLLGLTLAFAGCSKPTQEKTSEDLKAAGKEVGAAVKEVAATPAMKAVGSDIKQGVEEAGDKLEAGAKKAGAELKQGAKKAGDKTEAALNDANNDVKR